MYSENRNAVYLYEKVLNIDFTKLVTSMKAQSVVQKISLSVESVVGVIVKN